MSVTTSYPGVYIQELPSMSHSVTAAPTSVTVFIGYTHPFKTKNFRTAVEIFSFADYQANFGGFFASAPWLPDYVGNAVFQFFSNGGSDAWVIGLEPGAYLNAANYQAVKDGQGADISFSAPSAAVDVAPATVTFTAQVPGGVDPTTGATLAPTIQLANVRADTQGNAKALADIIIGFGAQVETYRAVPAAEIEQQLAPSALVSVSVANGTPATYPDAQVYDLGYPTAPPADSTLINPADYLAVFQAGASLDVDVPIFNLMVLPGISPVNEESLPCSPRRWRSARRRGRSSSWTPRRTPRPAPSARRRS